MIKNLFHEFKLNNPLIHKLICIIWELLLIYIVHRLNFLYSSYRLSFYSAESDSTLTICKAMKFGGNDWVVTPLFPCLLNKLNNPYFHVVTFLLFFLHVSLLLLLNNNSSSVPVKFLLVCLLYGSYPKHWLLPLYEQLIPFQWNKVTNELFVITLAAK